MKILDWLVDKVLSIMVVLFGLLVLLGLLMPSPYEKRFWVLWLPLFGAAWVGFFLAVWLHG